MQWTDDAILLSVRKFGENKALVRVFARNHGVNAGIVRGATSKTLRGILQAGNAVNVTWQARLSEQMGTFKIEPVKPFASFVMQDGLKLAALTSACALMETSLPERHPYSKLYEKFLEFLGVLTLSPPLEGGKSWPETYVKLELEILAESGFGLDLTQCAATGTIDNLVYVSPKSGRAVSEAAGEPYKEKLLALPGFLLRPPLEGGQTRETSQGGYEKKSSTTLPEFSGENSAPPQGGGEEISSGLALTGYFLEQRLAAPHGKKLPAARARLCDLLREKEPA